MVSLTPFPDVASSILNHVLSAAERSSPSHVQQSDEATKLIAIGLGTTIDAIEPEKSRSAEKLSAQLFSLDSQTIAKLKMQLFEKIGDALGVKLSAYLNFDEFAKGVEIAYRTVLREQGPAANKAIERETGLTDLKLSLSDVIDSMKDPEDNDKVSKALEAKYNIKSDKEMDAPSPHEFTWF